MEQWSVGVMEYWCKPLNDSPRITNHDFNAQAIQFLPSPSFHYYNIPLL